MIQTVRGGGQIDAVTPQEMRDFWHEQRQIESARERERQRTKKPLRRSTLLSSPAGTHVTLTDDITPNPGYIWVVRYISAYLASAGTGQAFITSDSTSTLSAITQSKCVVSYTTSAQYQAQSLPEGACVLTESEGIYLNFTQNITGYMIAGWEIAAERVGELA